MNDLHTYYIVCEMSKQFDEAGRSYMKRIPVVVSLDSTVREMAVMKDIEVIEVTDARSEQEALMSLTK